jgi:hypothetical protein
MHSPLPDASALEAGIIEDDRPARLSVQDNVRNLLRASVFGSVHGSTVASPAATTAHQATVEDGSHPHDLLSPSGSTTSSSTATTTTSEANEISGGLFSLTTYQQQVQEMAHQSTLFNTRAVAALNHPDLSDPSMALFLQQKTEARQRRAWKRSKNRKLRYAHARARRGRWWLCLLAGLLLGAIVGICKSFLSTAILEPLLMIEQTSQSPQHPATSLRRSISCSCSASC